MSSSADVQESRRKPVPIYRRKRQRIYGGIAALAVLLVALIIWLVTQGGSSGPAALPSFTISVSQGTVASPDSIIESQSSLAKTIPAHLHYVPFEAGVTAIAEMKSGSVQAISGVGNPPATAAIGNGTGVTVVMGWGFDDDQLLVPTSVTSPAQLAGKSVAVLVGSSEDYELLGYLALEHLTGKVKVVSFASETAAGAAALSGAVDSAYVYGGRPARERVPPAGQRGADRQARHPRPQCDRGGQQHRHK
jgi:ABC-type taurine transport system substrate-binding protein